LLLCALCLKPHAKTAKLLLRLSKSKEYRILFTRRALWSGEDREEKSAAFFAPLRSLRETDVLLQKFKKIVLFQIIKVHG